MADLNVSFIHPIDGRTVRVILDDDMTASEVIEGLVQNNVLALDSQSYYLAKKGGVSIQPDQTFRDAGVIKNDVIVINQRKTPKIDNEILKIRVTDQTRVTILLGSGASAPSGIATVNGLLEQLREDAMRMRRNDLNHLFAWCKHNNITNIEDLLTASYIASFAIKNENVLSLLGYFLLKEQLEGEKPFKLHRKDTDELSLTFIEETFKTLFGILAGRMLDAKPNAAHQAIVDFIKHHENTSIVTTNYDGCMDEAISRAVRNDAKNPKDGKVNNNIHKVKDVIKMHGAINWWCCDSCQNIHKTDFIDLKEAPGNYTVLGACRECRGTTRPLLVPPLSFKFVMFPNLTRIWSSASEAFDKADYLIVVGYSFSGTDTYISKMIQKSMTTNKNQKILIIDTNPNLAKTLRDAYSLDIKNSDETCVLQACASCDEILPRVLQSLLSESKPTMPEKTEGIINIIKKITEILT